MGQFFLVFIILVTFLIYIIYSKKDLLIPSNLFTIIILSSYMVSCLRLSDLQHEYDFAFTLKILLLILFFWLGTKVSLNSKRNENISNSNKEFCYNVSRLKMCINILFVLVVGAFFMTWIKLGPPPLISKTNRFNYYVSGIVTIYLMIDVLSFLIIFYIFDKKTKNVVPYIMLLAILVMIVLMSNKMQIIYLVCQFLVMYNIMKKKIKIKNLMALLLVVIAIFVIYYTYVYDGMYISNEDMYQVNRMNFSDKYTMLTNPYVYVAFNFENLEYYMSLDSTRLGLGYYTFSEILDSVGIRDIIYDNSDFLSEQWNNNLQYKWLTTGTICKEFFMDFGYLGMYLGMFCVGKLCQKSYINCKKYRSIFNIYFYSSNVICIFLAFFTNRFITITYIVNMICAYGINRLCIKTNSNESKEE